MAGGYPDTPGARLAYDLDGTIMAQLDNVFAFDDIMFPAGDSNIVDLNNESHDTAVFTSGVLAAGNKYVVWMFAEPRDLFGLWIGGNANDFTQSIFGAVETSTDTTAIENGTWVDQGLDYWVEPGGAWDTWREVDRDNQSIQAFSTTAAWGLRGNLASKGGLDPRDTFIYGAHIYGATNDAATPDRVIFLDKDTGLEFTTVYDFGFLPRGTIKEKAINVKNNSATLQANSVSLGFSSLMNGTPSNYMEMKDGAGAYSTSLALGNIAADVTYVNDITLKIDVGSTAGLGPVSVRLGNTITGWT